jgi:hypothetical protein
MIEEKPNSFFEKRMSLLGVTDELNTIDAMFYNSETAKNEYRPFKIFRPSEKGIEIHLTTLERIPINYAKDGARWKTNKFFITRLENPIVKDGNEMKYELPKGAGTFPFFPPQVISEFEKEGEVHTLVLTEGYFKAFKGAMHGLMIIGLSSISHFQQKNEAGLYPDIIKFIKKKKVKRVIWLQDGDCINITSKEITDGTDLYKRPNLFFASALAFKRYLDDFEDVEKYVAHPLSEEIKGNPKGLDDLLIAYPKEIDSIIADLLTVGKRESSYFFRENITFSPGKFQRYLRLDNVKDFYLYHIEKRKDLKGKEFVFNGTRYKYNEAKNECEVIVPGEAKNYFRVGDQYYEYVSIPNKYNILEKVFRSRYKTTITDDHGKNFCKFIPKYKAFCNVPDHTNYQKVIYNNFNIYAPFEHEPEEGEYGTILSFLGHIFGTGNIHFTHPKTGEKTTISELDLGLDYMQLLYTNPTQILPILCLVSKENNTGKTTFAKLLKMIFTQNVAIVGNADISDNFNASWASKLIVICDEAKIDKQIVVEKVKSLSTADKIMMNSKGKDHVELDFFAKFIFITNHEENFIYASDDDVRYWVRKVPVIKDLNVTMLENMLEEIPAFLHALDKRSMKTERLHRAWFSPQLIKTDALKKVIAHSQPTIEKEIRSRLRDMFLDFDVEEILMTKKAIHKEFFNGKYEDNYLEQVLKDRIKADTYHIMIKNDEGNDVPSYITKRHSYPKWEKVHDNGTEEIKRVDVNDNGRPYVFKRRNFVEAENQLIINYDSELDQLNKIMNENSKKNPKDDLPF